MQLHGSWAMAQGENGANGWRGRHAVAHVHGKAERERRQQTDGKVKAVIGEAAKEDGKADMQLHGSLATPAHWRGREREKERERERMARLTCVARVICEAER